MHRDNCERCGKPTNKVTTMSFFNTQVICAECKKTEQNHPDYKKAVEADCVAISNGNMNFEGIGLPDDLKV